MSSFLNRHLTLPKIEVGDFKLSSFDIPVLTRKKNNNRSKKFEEVDKKKKFTLEINSKINNNTLQIYNTYKSFNTLNSGIKTDIISEKIFNKFLFKKNFHIPILNDVNLIILLQKIDEIDKIEDNYKVNLINKILTKVYEHYSKYLYKYTKYLRRVRTNANEKFAWREDINLTKAYNIFFENYSKNELYKFHHLYINSVENIIKKKTFVEKLGIVKGVNNISVTKYYKKKYNNTQNNKTKIEIILNKITRLNRIDNINEAIEVIYYLMDNSKMLDNTELNGAKFVLFNNKLKQYYNNASISNELFNITKIFNDNLPKQKFYFNNKIDDINQKFINFINFVKIFMLIKLIKLIFDQLKNNKTNISNIINDKLLLLYTNIYITTLMNINDDCKISLCIFDKFTNFKTEVIDAIKNVIYPIKNNNNNNYFLIFLYLRILDLKKIFIDNMKKYNSDFTEKKLDDEINKEINEEIEINTSKSICELLQEHQQTP